MKIGIVGLGLIGGSFAFSVRKHRPEDELFISDINEDTMEKAKLFGLVDGELDSHALGEIELLLIALYPNAAVKWLRENAARISPSAIVVDCAGIKREICAVGAELSARFGFRFVGGHPMAGREVWGISSAFSDLFTGASMIMTPSRDADIATLAALKEWFLGIGFATVTVRSPEDHDRIIAYTSQLAHVLSSAYIQSPTAEEHRGLSAGSFRDMTRVAAINAEMWSEIFVSNADYLLPEIDRLIGGLSDFREAIAAGEREKLSDMLRDGARKKREADLR